ncbi:hypothetical protein [Arthrobacter sp. JSM 101049]|uniref:hypothetical protein n=1 Tax=Arthrobacter sp. JSM 101049 TaxID=929097 RepID=UPI00356871BC
MNAEDFKTGDQVAQGRGGIGVVIDDDANRAEYPGFVPVQWESGWRTMANAASLTLIDSRSATPQAGRGQTAGTPTPQGVPAPAAPRTLPNLIRRTLGLQERRTHDRADGPVVIDPEQKHRIVVKGDPR